MMTTREIGTSVAALLLAASMDAQQPNASAAAFGMAGNYTAAATGYDAVAWNPAALGMPGAKGFTINVVSAGGSSGLSPVTLADVAPFGGAVIPATTKESWLQKIGGGTERGGADGGVNLIALSMGRVGFQLGASGTGTANLNGDAVEAILYGNAGRTGAPKDLRFNGSNASGSGFITGALSVALPTSWKPMGGASEQFALGVTGKIVAGGGVFRAQDNGSLVTSSNVAVAFPMIYSPEANADNGSGFGLDLGAMWTSGTTTVGLAARNVVNTFSWQTSSLRSRLGTVTFDGTNSATQFDEAPYASAPAAMRAALEAESFKPQLSLGVARRMSSLLVSGDATMQVGDGIALGPKSHVGVGAEFAGIPFLPLRAGIAAVTGGVQAAGGLGIRIGSFEIGGGVSTRSREGGGSDIGAMISLVSIR